MKSDNQSIPFPDELLYLEQINHKLDEALEYADQDVERLNQEYLDLKRYMVENRGEIDPHEMFQNEQALCRIDHTGAFSVSLRDRLSKLKDSPYFCRIDFREEGCEETEKHYIGRFTFRYSKEILIFDWRAPIAAMFYDYELGSAGFDAPLGRIEGELTRKRQFKIKDGRMEYALESSVSIQDEVLLQELSHTSDDKMKSIIMTLQKEQNRIIRNEKAKTLIIQGVAGSGKTSIALHRIAYFLYRFKDKLKASNIIILSPNRVFGDYISSVLPELGEEPVYEMSFSDIAKAQLDGVIAFEKCPDPLEITDKDRVERIRFKSTLHFVKLLDEFILRIPDLVFQPIDYAYERFTAKADMIRSRYHNYSNYPIKKRLMMIAEDIYDIFATENFMQYELPKTKTILKSLQSMLTIKTTLSLYQKFYQQLEQHELFRLQEKNTLEWADVAPFLYLHAAFEGLNEDHVIKHLVIDEMQDYTPIQYAVINRLYCCPKTILGDFGQLINPYHMHTLEDLKHIYNEAEFTELNKSYRSTYEIITFAKRIKNVAALEPVERHGSVPSILSCKDDAEELACLNDEIKTFQKGKLTSLGIILKTNQEAQSFYHKLSMNYDIHLISPDSSNFTNGISITSVQMSKGLEFDKVIIPCTNNDTYSSEQDRGLLYIACTRALHELTLTHTGKLTDLIQTDS
jgi:DNA helicase-2/ATP-dependent DNA helicase PcrA